MPLDVDSGIELPQLELTHNFTGDCTTAYSTGIIYSIQMYRRLYNCLLYRYHLQYIAVQDTVQLLILQVPITVHSRTGDCTTAYYTGTNYSTQLYRSLQNCLFYRYHIRYIAEQDTVQLLTLQVSFTVIAVQDTIQLFTLQYHLQYISVQETVQLLTLQVSYTLHICTGDCTTAYSTGIIYSTQQYRILYNCLLYRYHLQYIYVQETVQLLIVQVFYT